MSRARRLAVAAWCAIVVALVAVPATAQMVLPGAVAPTPQGATTAPPASRPRPKTALPRLAPAQVPSEAALAGKTLALDGGKSTITFTAHDKQVEVSRLTLAGDMLSNSRAMCQVSMQSTPIAVKSLGQPNGVTRIQIDFPACPLVFDVLDGAALIDATQAVCEFKDADCRVSPVGLWGATPAELGPDQAKAIERERTHAEAAVRANYKALVASTKDRAAIMGFAREQAQFSSSREETCRDYAGEGRHGFCATKLTEARAALLRVRLAASLETKAARKLARQGKRAATK